MSIVTADGGLTTLGYALCAIAVIALVLVASFLQSKAGSAKKNVDEAARVLCDGDGACVRYLVYQSVSSAVWRLGDFV